jgi:hypothetical protein
MSDTFAALQSAAGANRAIEVAIDKSAVSQIIPQGVVTIQSVAVPGRYLRMDGTGVNSFSDKGGGTVNCQFGAVHYETFKLVPQPDDTVAIGSAAFPNVFVRLDGQGVQSREGGLVNCQYGAGNWEKFTVRLSYLLFMPILIACSLPCKGHHQRRQHCVIQVIRVSEYLPQVGWL